MTEEAKLAIEAVKQAFDVFEKMELPIKERKCTLEYDSVTAIISAFEQVTRERDAAVEMLRDAAWCCDCTYYEISIEAEPCKTCYASSSSRKPNWQWRGVEVDHGKE